MTTTPPCFTPRAAIYAHTATKRENINDQIAICKASTTICVLRWVAIDQPTTRLVQASRMKAR